MVPGFVLLWGFQPYSATLRQWLGQSLSESATVAGFLYTTVLAVGLGMLCSTARWLLVDRLFRKQDVGPATWNFKRLPATLPAFNRLIEDHFRYYQYHANSLLAVNAAMMLYWSGEGFMWVQLPALAVIDGLLYAGAADTLRKYDARMSVILGDKSSPLTHREEFPDLDL